MPKSYTIIGHDSTRYNCITEIYEPENATEYYKAVKDGREDPFSNSCLEKMQELVFAN